MYEPLIGGPGREQQLAELAQLCTPLRRLRDQRQLARWLVLLADALRIDAEKDGAARVVARLVRTIVDLISPDHVDMPLVEGVYLAAMGALKDLALELNADIAAIGERPSPHTSRIATLEQPHIDG